LTIAVFPADKILPMGALQRACGHDRRDQTKQAFVDLQKRSIVSRIEKGHLVRVHGLMHSVLTWLCHQKKEKRRGAAGGAAGEPHAATATGRARAAVDDIFARFKVQLTDEGVESVDDLLLLSEAQMKACGLKVGHCAKVQRLQKLCPGEGSPSAEEPAGGAREPAALKYFKAFHLVRSSRMWDALRKAGKEYGVELKDEEEIVMAAVRQNGAALQFASKELRGKVREGEDSTCAPTPVPLHPPLTPNFVARCFLLSFLIRRRKL
jgi:hypothetical protein